MAVGQGHQKGAPKTGGRKKGVPNKQTTITKEIINNIVDDYRSSGKMAADLAELQPRERIEAMIKLMSYILPKPQAVAIDVTGTKKVTIESTLEELAEENDF
jgi:hypothetical protein